MAAGPMGDGVAWRVAKAVAKRAKLRLMASPLGRSSGAIERPCPPYAGLTPLRGNLRGEAPLESWMSVGARDSAFAGMAE